MKVLVTCPPMLGMIDEFRAAFAAADVELTCPQVTQVLTVEQLLGLVPGHDGWIIGDDPACRAVLEAGRAGRLRAAVKWGVGVDNVDFAACRDLGLRITNTPGVFGAEVADLALGYVIALARQTHLIDRAVRAGGWPKPSGISLAGKRAAVIGYGDIGRHLAPRLRACGMDVTLYDPALAADAAPGFDVRAWPAGLGDCHFVVVTCALTESSRHLLDAGAFARMLPSVRVVNVSRGPVIDEAALVAALQSGHVHSAALDVFEVEPLPAASPLRGFERCVFGSHNASNTRDAVVRTSLLATRHMLDFLGRSPP
jgi:D-3-phosphoglycerate dehydrogenase